MPNVGNEYFSSTYVRRENTETTWNISSASSAARSAPWEYVDEIRKCPHSEIEKGQYCNLCEETQ